MKKVLIVVDMQRDFIDMALGTPEARAIVPRVVAEIKKEEYDTVIATLDTHGANYLETFEGKHLPVPHCVKPSAGWQLNDEVRIALEERGYESVEKPTFGSETLMALMKAARPETITMTGLCTDICVISNALLIRAALPQTEIKVIADACAGVTPARHQAALEVMASCQIDVI